MHSILSPSLAFLMLMAAIKVFAVEPASLNANVARILDDRIQPTLAYAADELCVLLKQTSVTISLL